MRLLWLALLWGFYGIGKCPDVPPRVPVTPGLRQPTYPPRLPTKPVPIPLTGMRLNRTWTPRHYNLRLQPWVYDPFDARLNGTVEIYMSASEISDVIILHAQNLTINQTTMQLRETGPNGRRITIKDFIVDEPRSFIKVYASEKLNTGREYYLKLDFEGTLLHKLLGFYRAKYIYQNTQRFVAVTQFEENYARRAFPCFDDPSFKATFTTTLIHKSGWTALSNTDIDRTTRRGDWVEDTFRKTPIMSTYLVAMFVGQYVSRERITPRGTKVRVWTQPDYINYAETALQVTGELIETYEDYTGIKYPLSKTDQVAVGEFEAGAMENWGLIVYLNSQFLIKPDTSTTVDLVNSVTTIAHEVAHQWFGNLVTMRWWDDTFLNEGFTTFISNFIGVPGVKPTWNQPLYYITNIQKIMAQDTQFDTQPVRLEGLSASDDLHKAFSLITYDKGSSILRMLRYVMKESVFKSAVRSYLRQFSYNNVEKADFVRVFDNAAGSQRTWDEARANFSEIVTSWIDQPNYPLLQVTDLNDGRIRVKQSRFTDFPNMETQYSSPFNNYSWHIPFTYANQPLLNRQGYQLHWIYRDHVVNFRDDQVTGWKLANVFMQGYYRVMYDDQTWTDILNQLERDSTLIPAESRSEIIDDAFAFAAQGYTDEVRALQSTPFLYNETEYVVFRPFLDGRLTEYVRLLTGTLSYSYLSNYVLNLIFPTYERLGWSTTSEEPPMTKQLRSLVLREACIRQYQPCVLEALRQFQQYKNMVEQNQATNSNVQNPIDPDLRPIVYCTAMRHGTVDVLQFLMRQVTVVQSSQDFTGQELTSLLLGIVCAHETVSFESMIQWALALGNKAVLDIIAAQPGSLLPLWDQVDKHWDMIPMDINKDAIMWTLTEYFSTPSELQKLRHFINDHSDIHPLFADEVIAKVKDNINWVNRNEPAIRDWLTTPAKMPSGGRKRRSASDRKLPFSGYRYPTMGSGRTSKHLKGMDIGKVNVDDVAFVFRDGKLKTESRNGLVHRLKS